MALEYNYPYSSPSDQGISDTVGNAYVAPSWPGGMPRQVDDRASDIVNVMDFGAIGDKTLHTVAEWIDVSGQGYIVPGLVRKFNSLTALQTKYPFVTDTGYSLDLLAFHAAAQACRQKYGGNVPSLSGSPRFLSPGGHYYMFNRPLFLGCDRGGAGTGAKPFDQYPNAYIFFIDGDGSNWYFAMDDMTKVGVDITGSRYTIIKNVNITGDVTNYPRVGLFVGRGGLTDPLNPATGRSSDMMYMSRVSIEGSFGLCGYYEFASEDVQRTNCYTRVTGGTAKACRIHTKANHEHVPLDFQTQVPDGDQLTYVGGQSHRDETFLDIASPMPADAANVIMWGVGKYVHQHEFLSQLNGQAQNTLDGGRPHYLLTGTDSAANTWTRQYFDNPHHHAFFGCGVRVKTSGLYFRYRASLFNGPGRQQGDVVLEDNVLITYFEAEGEKFVATGASGGLQRGRLHLLNPVVTSSFAGALRGMVTGPAASSVLLTSVGVSGYFFVNTVDGTCGLNGVPGVLSALKVTNSVSGAVNLDGTTANAFLLNMTGSVTAVTITNMPLGFRFKVTFTQDATGTLNIAGFASYFKTNDPKGVAGAFVFDYTNRAASKGCTLDCYVRIGGVIETTQGSWAS